MYATIITEEEGVMDLEMSGGHRRNQGDEGEE